MLVPYQQLNKITLNNLIEQYILREGTDYGEIEFSLQQKTQQILRQVKNSEIHIVYSELTESVTLISKQEFEQAQIK